MNKYRDDVPETVTEETHSVVQLGFQLVTTEPSNAQNFYSWLFLTSAETQPGDLSPTLDAFGFQKFSEPQRANHKLGWIPEFGLQDFASTLNRAEAYGFSREFEVSERSDSSALLLDRHGVKLRLSQLVDPVPSANGVMRFLTDYWAADARVALSDYSGLFGVSTLVIADDPNAYSLIHDRRTPVMGIVRYSSASGIPDWFPYIRVADVERVAALALEVGCRLRVPLQRTPIDRHAVLEDPFGNLFSVTTVHAYEKTVGVVHGDGSTGIMGSILD